MKSDRNSVAPLFFRDIPYNDPMTTEDEQQAALDAAKDAAQDAFDKTKDASLSIGERILWIFAAIVCAVLGSLLTSCTALTVTPQGTTATGEHGETVIMTPGMFSYSQPAPQPSGDVIVQPSKK